VGWQCILTPSPPGEGRGEGASILAPSPSGGRGTGCGPYLFEHVLKFTRDLVVPRTRDPIPHTFQLHRSPRIAGHPITVLSAIGFDDQSGFQAWKVHNTGFNHHLAAELISHQTTCPQTSPQYALRIAGLVVKCTQVDSLSLSLSLRRERGPFVFRSSMTHLRRAQ
jgi:hypothetical protein